MKIPIYREEKATQVAALFLRLNGGKIDYGKLMDLMYLAEREALIRWGRPITFDKLVNIPDDLHP